ncbi:hypothetical protein IKF23_03365 [Candidatus Saccharibacteria bacterium]|nr:hypothetical protein [Candidatus Saccharibacteria bacterium]
MESNIKIHDSTGVIEANFDQPEDHEKAKRKLFMRIGVAALATAYLSSPFATPKETKYVPISMESQDNQNSTSDSVIEFIDPAEHDSLEMSASTPQAEIAAERELSIPESEGTTYIVPVAPTAENGGTQYVVPVGGTPTTDPHQQATSKAAKKTPIEPKASNIAQDNFSYINNMPTIDITPQQPIDTPMTAPINIAPSPIADGLDSAMRTAFAEGAYTSEEAARKIADVIINRAVNKGTSVGAEVAAKGQFEAYINGTKGKGNWGWREYGSGPQNGSIGTERVQQIFIEELNKATSGQPLAYNYTRFSASGDGINNVYH